MFESTFKEQIKDLKYFKGKEIFLKEAKKKKWFIFENYS